MRSALHAPVPSSALLKFLRCQTEEICFFSTNPASGFVFDHAAPRTIYPRSGIAKSPKRYTSPAATQHVVLKAGLINLDFSWPRTVTTARLQPRSHGVVRDKKLVSERSIGAIRSFSTRTKWFPWRRKLWGVSSKRGGQLHADDLPARDDNSGDDYSLGHRISAKAAAQPKLRCTELDENGTVVLASGEFKKSELIAKVLT